MPPYNFGPAIDGEEVVYGASRPSHPAKQVATGSADEWISFMRSRGIQRVVCLLPPSQLAYYEALPGGLLGLYGDVFGPDNVCSVEIEDFHLSSPDKLRSIMSFLRESDLGAQQVVVHCSGGSGRTGHVLAAWLVYGRGLDPESALAAVQTTSADRNPYEAVGINGVTEADLIALIEGVESAKEA